MVSLSKHIDCFESKEYAMSLSTPIDFGVAQAHFENIFWLDFKCLMNDNVGSRRMPTIALIVPTLTRCRATKAHFSRIFSYKM